MWLKEIERYAHEDVTLLAAGTKCDLVSGRVIDKQMMDDFFSQTTPPIPCFEVSAKTGYGVEELFMTATNMWLTKMQGEPLDKGTSPVRNVNDNVETAESSSKNENVENKNCIIC